jgi:hypothetical protein
MFQVYFQLFHLFQTYVASVSSRYCKSRSKCCIYMHVANICLKCFQLLETYVSSVFIWVLHIFCNGYTRVFLVFQMYVASVSAILDVCCKCFYLNVAKVDRVLHIL